MSKSFTLRSGLLAMSLLTAAGFATAADQAPAQAPAGKHAQHRHFDPVARAQHNLDNLAAKLNLKEEQKGAWQAYSDSAISRARARAAKMQERRSHQEAARVEPETSAKLDRMAQAMRARADHLQQVAQDTRAFEGVLTPEQKTIFDLYWKGQMKKRMGHHRHA